ncbi:MAG TPA: LLM class F420-dependent oxidoreductase [Anaerolineaceae bacterium]|nr:LLM class F420-dependent oxidoreductase [Anaerolineaceae bacterium]
MKIGLQIPKFTWQGGSIEIGRRLTDIATTADSVGFASIWVMDHFFQIQSVGNPEEPMLESYSALSFIAGCTQHARIGTMVTGVIYRHPGILVKTITTLDVLSGGRAYFGIGAAWFEREALGLGVQFPPIKERFVRLEETLQIALQMWSGKVDAYRGTYYQLAETLCSPLPVSKPHPPILIGGGGEKITLKLVAKYANACNLFARLGPDVLKHKLDVLKRHCDMVDRDYSEIEKTALNTINLAPGAATTTQMIEECHRLSDLGIQHVIFNMPNVSEIKPLEIIGREVIPEVAGY